MGLLDKMDKLESTVEPSDQQTEKSQLKEQKKVPQLKMGGGKKKKVSTKKPATNDKFKNLSGGVKKPDTLANAKKTSNSSLHTHLNKTDQHGVSHKDRIEEELQAQVKKIKKIMAISIAGLVGLIFAIWLIIKIMGWISSDSSANNGRGTSFFKLKANAIQYVHSDKFNADKFDKVFDKFYKQATSADKAKAIKLKARLLQERTIKK